jgi:hypothetical protein
MVSFFTAVVLVAASAPGAGAAEGQSAEGETAKGFPASNPLVIPAAAFSTKGNDPQSHYMRWLEGYLEGTSSPGGCVQAPVYLPRFARVYQLWMSYIDEDGGNDFSVWFDRTATFSAGGLQEMATVSSSGSDPNVRSVGDYSVNHPIVVHPDYSYYVSACLPSENTKLLSVRIWYYTDVIFVDGFDRGNASAWGEVLP